VRRYSICIHVSVRLCVCVCIDVDIGIGIDRLAAAPTSRLVKGTCGGGLGGLTRGVNPPKVKPVCEGAWTPYMYTCICTIVCVYVYIDTDICIDI